jgi:rubrerythrin
MDKEDTTEFILAKKCLIMGELTPEMDESLKMALDRESYGRTIYLAFARSAEEGGLNNLSKLFRAAAESETVHAMNLLDALGEIGDAYSNIKRLLTEEDCDIDSTYPTLAKEALKEGRSEASIAFNWILSVEKEHKELFRKALPYLEKEDDIEEECYFLCENCGYISQGLLNPKAVLSVGHLHPNSRKSSNLT